MQSASIRFDTQWHPFLVRTHKADPTRSLLSPEGVADRLRLVAFAELQARDAFLWGAQRFKEAPEEWKESWTRFAVVEDRHAQMLLSRMQALGVEIGGRWVSDKLTRLCRLAEDPVTFLFLLSSAEERGMEAGFTLGEQMKQIDPESAALFDQIAREEVEHVSMAKEALSSFSGANLQERARSLSALI